MKQIKVELQAVYGGDREIAESAWTSSTTHTSKKLKTKEDVERVVNMLADHKHSTPFESVIFRFWFRLPVAIDRQLMTHRLQSASGMSARYRTMPHDYLDFDDEVYEILSKGLDSNQADQYESNYIEICEEANRIYNNLIKELKASEKEGKISNSEYKRVREFYRGVLPQHNMTERVSVMNFRSFCNFQKLRNNPHAQPEIRKLAEDMLKSVEASGECKVALEAAKRNNWVI